MRTTTYTRGQVTTELLAELARLRDEQDLEITVHADTEDGPLFGELIWIAPDGADAEFTARDDHPRWDGHEYPAGVGSIEELTVTVLATEPQQFPVRVP